MKDKTKLLQQIQEYTEEELIYKQYYELRDQPEARKTYLQEAADLIREKRLIFPDAPPIKT